MPRGAYVQRDQVGRVKNKWKIQLKDGVINADGKDYLFNKFNGCAPIDLRLNAIDCSPWPAAGTSHGERVQNQKVYSLVIHFVAIISPSTAAA